MRAAARIATVLGVLAVVPAAFAAEEQPPRVLRLDDAVATAVKNQPTVLVARAQTEAARGRVEQARSGYLPQVTGSALFERIHTPSGSSGVASTVTQTGTTGGGTATPITTSGGTYDLFQAGVSATQLIYDFGQTIDRTKAAAASRDAQESSERTARQQVMLQVRSTFFQAHAQKALVSVGNESVTNQERHLAQIQGFVGQGIRPEIDLAQARTDLANAKVTLINAKTNYVTAKAQLNQAMGVQGPLDFEVSDDDLPGVADEDQPVTRLVALASEARPELQALIRQRHAAELTLSAIHGAYGPALSALGGVSESGVALDSLGTRWYLGLGLNWPLFQGGLTAGQSREARANIDVAAAQITAQQLQIRVEVEQAQLAIQSAKVVIEAAKDATTNAREQLRLAEGRYESGVGSIIELDDAQLAVQSAEAQSVQSEFSLALARAQLLSALGR
ncbi:MAG TPA: TolC family protein [Polyangiaceae bacterium]|jgi:outer membrane protein|nr:TolC family protein [Polyangiaceae bacterium]